ncbi:hypothetical protein TREPR_3222 [Treponema primitia ZAS-2]|uniref:Uncharacterized protein n=1 Tax=Treponema primitia (strain ATCC BAA-887 / DSM 12427 / ZAS-2) TaxID=545694 RepID=F5YKZ1_TREPZ|nr:hypothetical protein TREPR_3222 [Treponema primitia ZAS-2]
MIRNVTGSSVKEMANKQYICLLNKFPVLTMILLCFWQRQT